MSKDLGEHNELLRSVSRSFYLSIRFLPAPMREPIALGYLLARTSDTLSDSISISLSERLRALDRFRDAIRNSSITPAFSDISSSLPIEAERNLLEKTPEILEWHRSLTPEVRQHVSKVVDTIIGGQRWDLETFSGETIAGCKTGADLLRYAYSVAGCVGEFWTWVGYETMGKRFADPHDEPSLLKHGKELGLGLQLVNILRDLHEDLPNRRCYLPADELMTERWDGKFPLLPRNVEPVFDHWIGQCRNLLEGGKTYVRLVRNRRARYCTDLPLRLAEATLARLQKEGAKTVMEKRIKISRLSVWKIALACGLRN